VINQIPPDGNVLVHLNGNFTVPTLTTDETKKVVYIFKIKLVFPNNPISKERLTNAASRLYLIAPSPANINTYDL
jgi:hypothetical protein